ncbi:O-antigen ligase family protein [Aromatoleum bremense]|uniref:O-antigen ligase family protein n=1 Tax=Aromatoleum bremense TaxID=76115 RepID=UPI001AEBF5AE|nr:O-antigen ligase family protein [Aromatoleum bremense]QTQ32435.1 O-antigen ligase-related protein [Aromatoleum bremense]
MRFLDGFSRDGREAVYFTFALLLFIASFLLLPTTKMVNNVYYVFLAVPALVAAVRRRGRGLRWAPDLLLWTMFIAWFVIVGVWSGDGQYFKHVLYVALFVLLVRVFADPAIFRKPVFARGLFWVLTVYVMGSAVIYWIVGRYAVGERVLWLPARMTGPIYTSMWLACCFALALPVWLRECRRLEMGVALSVAVFCIAYVLQSRSGLFGLAVLLILLGASAVWRRSVHSFSLIGLAAAIGGILFLLGSQVPELASLVQRADSGRFELWAILIAEWMECGLWTGCGMDHGIQIQLSQGMLLHHPHNIFLALGLFSGAVALFIFLALMFTLLRRAWSRRDPWGLYLLTALVMLNFDGTKLVGNPDELWLLVLLPAALIGNDRGRHATE